MYQSTHMQRGFDFRTVTSIVQWFATKVALLSSTLIQLLPLFVFRLSLMGEGERESKHYADAVNAIVQTKFLTMILLHLK